MTSQPTLPDELILQIFHFTPSNTLWISARLASRQLQHCAEDILRLEILPRISLSLTFSLGGGAHHRWYDVRATLTFGYSHLTSDGDMATFKLSHVRPSQCHAQALEKWSRFRADDASTTLSAWRAELDGRTYSVPLQPEIQFEESEDDVGIAIRWKDLLSRYFWEAEQATIRIHGTAAG